MLRERGGVGGEVMEQTLDGVSRVFLWSIGTCCFQGRMQSALSTLENHEGPRTPKSDESKFLPAALYPELARLWRAGDDNPDFVSLFVHACSANVADNKVRLRRF